MLVEGCRNARMNELVVFGTGQANVKVKLERCGKTVVELKQKRRYGRAD